MLGASSLGPTKAKAKPNTGGDEHRRLSLHRRRLSAEYRCAEAEDRVHDPVAMMYITVVMPGFAINRRTLALLINGVF